VVPVVAPQLGDGVAVDVADDRDQVAHAAVPGAVQDAVPGGLVAAPAVHAHGARAVLHARQIGDHRLVGQEVPAGGGVREAVEDPPLLLAAGDGALRVGGDRVLGVLPVAVRLVAPVLAGVEYRERGQVPVFVATVDAHVRAGRRRDAGGRVL